jgi:hypothetical protein
MGQGSVNFSDFVSGVVFSHVYGPQTDDPANALTGNIATVYSPGTPFGDYPPGATSYNGPLLGGASTGPTNQTDFTNGFLYTAQLWAAPGDDAPVSSLQPVGQYTTTLRTGPTMNAAGFIIPLSFTSSNADPGIPGTWAGSATCQLRVWYNGGGTIPDWATALMSGVLIGSSPPFNVDGLVSADGLPPALPANLAGLQSFNLFYPNAIPPPGLQSATLTGSSGQTNSVCSLAWAAVSGHTYQVQYTTNIAQPVWLNLGGPCATTNGIVTASDGVTNAQRFYRLMLVQ